MSLSRYEKETIINYNETDGPASVYTFNAALQRKLDKLAQTSPNEVKCVNCSPEKCKEYLVPKNWVKVSPPRKFSDSTREKMAERGRRQMAVLHAAGKGG